MRIQSFKSYCLVLFLLACNAADKEPQMPSWLNQFMEAKGLSKRYLIDAFQQPGIIEADFNRDGTADIAVLILEKNTKKKGILLVHGRTKKSYIFGAGTKFGSGGDDFGWVDKWLLYTDKTASETLFDEASGDILGGREVKLDGPGLLTEAYEDGGAVAGGIIYWNGKDYIWIHQGE